jgi:hypothetical protein
MVRVTNNIANPSSSLCPAASMVDGDSDAAAMALAIVQPNGRRVCHTNEARCHLSVRSKLGSMRTTPWREVTGVQARPRARRIGAARRRHICRSGSVYRRSLEHATSSSALGVRPAYRSPRSLTYRRDAAAAYGSSFVCRPTSIRRAGLVRRRRTGSVAARRVFRCRRTCVGVLGSRKAYRRLGAGQTRTTRRSVQVHLRELDVWSSAFRRRS